MLALRLLLITGLALVVMASCSSDDDENPVSGGGPPADTPSFATDVQPVLASMCAKPACHGNAGSPTGGLFMGSPPTRTSILAASGNNGQAVIVGAGSGSNLYIKTTPNPVFNARMPADGPPFLTVEQQENIRLWIDLGAPDN